MSRRSPPLRTPGDLRLPSATLRVDCTRMSELQRRLQPAAASKVPALPAEAGVPVGAGEFLRWQCQDAPCVCHNSGNNIRMCAPLVPVPDRQPWVFRPIHCLPRPLSHPCPEPHERDQPLPFEALKARNAGKTLLVVCPQRRLTPQVVCRSRSRFQLPNPSSQTRLPTQAPATAAWTRWAMPPGQTLAPGYSRTVLGDCLHGATWERKADR